MRILVTGGAGFIGSAVARIAIADGHDVMVVDKLTYAGNLSTLKTVASNPHFQFLQADVCDEDAIVVAMKTFEPDAVMNPAAESHVDG